MREFKKYFFEGLLQLTILAALMRQNNIMPSLSSSSSLTRGDYHRQFIDYFNWYPHSSSSNGSTTLPLNVNLSLVDHLASHIYLDKLASDPNLDTLLSSSSSSSRLNDELRRLNRLNARIQQQQQQHNHQTQQSNYINQPPVQHFIVAPSYFYMNNNNPKDHTDRSETRLLLNSIEFNNNQLTKEVKHF